jgi:endonuclease G
MMTTALERLARLREFNARIRSADKPLGEESLEAAARGGQLETAMTDDAVDNQIAFESIVMRTQRPVLAILESQAVLEFQNEAESTTWKERLTDAKQFLDSAIRSVGRIELTGSEYDWIGTGWLVHDNIVVTNRHVANEFAERKGEGFTFRMGSDGAMTASVDFLQEIGNADTLVFRLVRPLFINAEGPDVSFFEIEVASGNSKLARPIALARKPRSTKNVAVIGYPAYDSRIPDTDLMERIYGRTYNKKRLAPGGVTRVEQLSLLHDCTTLGGNSGSAVVDLDSGEALGLHFSGKFMTANYAVRSDIVKRLLADVRAGRVRPEVKTVVPTSVATIQSVAIAGQNGQSASGRSASITIPLTVTVSIGDLRPSRPQVVVTAASDADRADEIEGEEAAAADYKGREGYAATFLGDRFEIPLPSVVRDAEDVLKYANDGKADTVLRYEHYSVVMSKSRRMCFFSAANIDGGQSRKSARVAWKWDPRIPRTQQIMNECYGAPPKFSRGHMTRREDPGWGDPKTAKRGNEDSMHVTNTTPQMQAFNAPIWLALEDYALQHAREDEMKISVFTGPYFATNDPVMYGIRIPRAFWKVIAFIHDDTGELCATGYQMTQQQSLPDEEFVFGTFTSPQLHVATQVPIASIETLSGLSFGDLASVDPLADGDEAVSTGPLQTLEQIRFVR